MTPNSPQTLHDLVWLNGELRRSSDTSLIGDMGLFRGDGLFETMRLLCGEVVALDHHLDRILTSSAELRIHTDRAELETATHVLLDAIRPDLPHEAILRITLTAATTLIHTRPIPPSISARRNGLEAWRFNEPRHDTLLARHKSLAWTANAVHTRLHPRGHEPSFEGIWVATDGAVLEGASTSLFGVLSVGDGLTVITAPTTRPILPGVTRSRAIATLRAHGVRVDERDFDWETWTSCSEVFATSATLPVAPVVQLEHLTRPIGPICEWLLARL